jgi:hypothetical protein
LNDDIQFELERAEAIHASRDDLIRTLKRQYAARDGRNRDRIYADLQEALAAHDRTTSELPILREKRETLTTALEVVRSNHN